MRALCPLLALVLMVGCSSLADHETGGTDDSLSEKKGGSIAYAPCAASRDAIMHSTSPARAEVIARGFEWLDADVPFNLKATYESYRTDCSGFVSMCWSLRAPGRNTREFGKAKTGTHRLGSYDDLVPADGLVNAGVHSMIFLGWNDAERTGACVLEQSSRKNDMQFRVRMTAALKSAGFVPIRSDRLADDSSYTPTHTKDSTDSTDGDDTDANVPACVSRPPGEICAEARENSGVECGRVVDNCGRSVNCSHVPTFGCAEGATCTANRCTSTCTPRYRVDLCYSARLSKGVECGDIDDGCGGTMNCDDLAYFGCEDGQICGATAPNRCPKAPESPKDPPSKDPPHEDPPQGDPPTGDSSSDESADADSSSQDSPFETEGDRGDDGEEPSADSNGNAEREGSSAGASAKPRLMNVPSSGCSSAPGANAGALPALAMLLMVGARRRSRKP